MTISQFDYLFRNLQDTASQFMPINSTKIGHPVDVFYSDECLSIEVACTGLTKSDVDIDIEGDVIKISYKKNKIKSNINNEDSKNDLESVDKNFNYIYRGISKKSFNLAYKISSKYDLTKAEAELTNGLLQINIPLADEAKPKKLKIK